MIRNRIYSLLNKLEGVFQYHPEPPSNGMAVGQKSAAGDGWSSHKGSHAAPPAHLVERRAFIRERLESHKREYLRYEVGLLGVNHRLSPGTVRKLLQGEDARDAAPTLRLATDQWAWRAGEIERLILEEAGPLQLAVPAGGSLVDARVSRACRDWARAEAQRRVESALGEIARGE
jgi:hypothetical protein